MGQAGWTINKLAIFASVSKYIRFFNPFLMSLMAVTGISNLSTSTRLINKHYGADKASRLL